MSKNNLFLIGRGDANLENDGHYSDFFWAINSNFDLSRIFYNSKDKSVEKRLIDSDIKIVNGFHISNNKTETLNTQILPAINNASFEEKEILYFLQRFNKEVNLYQQFFHENNIKIFFTWHKFNSSHLAFGKAINNLGGVSIYWPTSFDGLAYYDSLCNFDIIFSYSRFNAMNDIASGSKFKYNIITGYVRDYAEPLLIEESLAIRKKLELNGAKKIVFVVDENGLKDERWHTGAGLQKDNYSFILEQVILNPWLGVIFKPKVPDTLHERLGEVAHLLKMAEKTGRCLVLRNKGNYSPPPLLAGLSSDLCIHAHLSAGTVGMECALAGVPTLLIDREGSPFSKLHELPKNKVVFDNWPQTIKAMIIYFKNKDKDQEFGNWESIINQLDPFRDGMAAYRIGSLINTITSQLDSGETKDNAMKFAVNEYANKWGNDKVITLD
jgi:hypothetical protein